MLDEFSQAANDYLQSIIETVREPFLVLDQELRVRTANRSFLQAFGVSDEETAGQLVYELGNGQWNIPRLRTLLVDILSGNSSFNDFEVSHAFEHIGRRTMLLNARKVYRPGNHTELILLAFEDVTERNAAARRLSDYESRLRLIFESVKDFSIFTTDLDGIITSWNAGAENVFGYREFEAIGQPASLVFTPEDRAAGVPEREMESAASTGRGTDERWHLRKDGSRFFASGMVTPLTDDAGTLIGFTKVARDATERMQAEQQLRMSEVRYRSLFNSIDEGFCVIEMLFDPDGKPFDYRFLETNPAFEKQTGLKEVEGKRIRELAPGHEAHWFETYGNVALTGESMRFTEEAKALNQRWYDVYAFRVGELEEHRVAVLFNDISQQKEMEQSLRHRARELAEADQRKNEFLAMLAHELRNPLAAIHNGVNLANMPGAEKHLPEILSIIGRQTTNLTRMIDDLLDVSRITQGKVELKKEPVELAPLIQRAAAAVRPLIEQRKHELTLQLSASPIRVEADPTRLEQIIVNLLNNAAKYSENGGTITVSATRDGSESVIRVKDTGVGISPEMLPKIFDMFTQVDPTLARSEGGLGIGLTLVKQLVEMHGGCISAVSEVGKGSEFTVRLPLLETVTVTATPRQGPQVTGAGRKVLIVDDNADTAKLTGRLLQMVGFTTQISHDGKAAIEQAKAFQPEVVLLDIGLPGMNGYQVARQLRQEGCCHASLIIGISGYGDADAREQARQAGFDHHLVKPVDIQAVTELVAGRRA